MLIGCVVGLTGGEVWLSGGDVALKIVEVESVGDDVMFR